MMSEPSQESIRETCVAAFQHRGRAFSLRGYAPDDAIFQAIVAGHSFYEVDLLDYIRVITAPERGPGAVAIDIGANIGNHSVYFGAFVAERVLAVEPNPTVLPILRRNIECNVANVRLFDCAVGESDARGRVVMPVNAVDNMGMARIVTVDGGDATAIPVRTVDALVAELASDGAAIGRVLVMKIDVEGMELDVLKGARATLERHRPHLFVEAWTAAELAALRAHLGSAGYVVLQHWAATPVYHFAWQPRLALRLRAALYTLLVKTGLRVARVARALRRRLA